MAMECFIDHYGQALREYWFERRLQNTMLGEELLPLVATKTSGLWGKGLLVEPPAYHAAC